MSVSGVQGPLLLPADRRRGGCSLPGWPAAGHRVGGSDQHQQGGGGVAELESSGGRQDEDFLPSEHFNLYS